MQLERHPQLDADVRAVLADTLRDFGPLQVSVYEQLIIDGIKTIVAHPTIGRIREDIGPGVRVFCIAQRGIDAPHGYIYRVKGECIQVARLVHLARYLPALVPHDF